MFLSIRRPSFTKTIELFFAMAPVVLLAPMQASGQGQAEYCAFEVVVNSPDGKPVVGADAVLTRDGGTVGTAVTNEGGVARICDAPSDALLDVEVGGKLCGAVAVRHLKTYWMRTRRVYITYLGCHGEVWWIPGGCEFTIRTRDQRGAPLGGVVFQERQPQDPQGEQPERISDRFGRVFLFLAYGRTFAASLQKPGYAVKVITGDCQVGGETAREVTTVLEEERESH